MISRSKLVKIKELLLKLKQKKHDKYDWNIQSRDEQKIPPGDWNTWCIIAGRGFGKTRTGAETVREFAKLGYKSIGLIGKSINEIRQVMLEGKSGLLSIYPPSQKPKLYSSLNMVILPPNNARAYLISADNPDHIRGYQFDLVWLDEFAKFPYPDECWKQVSMALRLGQKPRAVITTTPKKLPILESILSKKTTYYTSGTTYANRANLSEDFIRNIAEYEGTSFASQEIYGAIAENSSGLQRESIKYGSPPGAYDKIIISIDPAVTCHVNSDETGIVIIGKADAMFYVIGDYSMKAQASVWMSCVANLYKKYNASAIVIEVNQGGSLYVDMFKEYGIFSIIEVRAIHNKASRAQLTHILYQKGLVYHVKQFQLLEEQLIGFNWMKKNNKSPDRVDALTWGLKTLHNMTKAYIIEI